VRAAARHALSQSPGTRLTTDVTRPITPSLILLPQTGHVNWASWAMKPGRQYSNVIETGPPHSGQADNCGSGCDKGCSFSILL
jgi:hypothetical protein